MAKPQLYINVGQTLMVVSGCLVVTVLGTQYLAYTADAVGIQKGLFKARIKEDIKRVFRREEPKNVVYYR